MRNALSATLLMVHKRQIPNYIDVIESSGVLIEHSAQNGRYHVHSPIWDPNFGLFWDIFTILRPLFPLHYYPALPALKNEILTNRNLIIKIKKLPVYKRMSLYPGLRASPHIRKHPQKLYVKFLSNLRSNDCKLF